MNTTRTPILDGSDAVCRLDLSIDLERAGVPQGASRFLWLYDPVRPDLAPVLLFRVLAPNDLPPPYRAHVDAFDVAELGELLYRYGAYGRMPERHGDRWRHHLLTTAVPDAYGNSYVLHRTEADARAALLAVIITLNVATVNYQDPRRT